MERGKLAGNPRSSPIEKHSDLWKKYFSVLRYVNSLLCVLYKDVMRFCDCLQML